MGDTDQLDRTTAAKTRPRRGKVARTVRAVGWTSIWLGVFLLGFLVHQLFVTTYFAQRHNEVLEAEAIEYFDTAEITQVEYTPDEAAGISEPSEPGATTDPGDPFGQTDAGGGAEPRLIFAEGQPSRGQPFAVIRIPTIDSLSDGWAVVEGVARSQLKTGAGHYPSTPLPGQPGNAAIAGHRTTYGAPFHDLDQLDPGDNIVVESALGTSVYQVRETIIVPPTAIWVTQDRPGAWLTLTTCHPRFSSRQRLVVFSELVSGPNYESIYGA